MSRVRKSSSWASSKLGISALHAYKPMPCCEYVEVSHLLAPWHHRIHVESCRIMQNLAACKTSTEWHAKNRPSPRVKVLYDLIWLQLFLESMLSCSVSHEARHMFQLYWTGYRKRNRSLSSAGHIPEFLAAKKHCSQYDLWHHLRLVVTDKFCCFYYYF